MEFKSYFEIDKLADRLIAEEKYQEALRLLSKEVLTFPEYRFENRVYQAAVRSMMGQHETAFKIFQELVMKGQAIPLRWGLFEPLKSMEGYVLLDEENQHLVDEAQKTARMEYEVYLPDGYNERTAYPLMMLLHGNSMNMTMLKASWPPDSLLRRGFIVVYAQSSQVSHYRAYDWTGDFPRARKDLVECFAKVSLKYSIEQDCVLLGGFSAGAIASIDSAFSNNIPTKGFIVLCPEIKPPGFTKESVEAAVRRGMKGVMLEGEKAVPVQDEEEMVAELKKCGFPYRYWINQGCGHWFPDDFQQKLEEALDFILE